jgi:hypothetical protein
MSLYDQGFQTLLYPYIIGRVTSTSAKLWPPH